MRPSKKKDLSLAVLVALLVAAGGLLPLAYRYGLTHRPVPPAPAVATAPAPEAVAPVAPGTEIVPGEEAESDRGPTSATPTGPTLSFARAAGLHLAPDPLRLNSSVALVVDQDTGEVLVRKNDQEVLPIASLTKLMSTLVVLEAKQPMDEVLTITEDDVDKERNSRSRLRVGTTLTREQALHLALMSSENRAAHALGRHYPGGLPKLIEAMNARARQLGMKNTTYVDPTGLSNRNQSTAQDTALLVSAAAKNPALARFSTTPAHVASLGGRTMQYLNSNRLVRSDSGAWDIGLQKTGYIVEAGRCLTMLTRVAGHNLIMVLLDADSNGQRVADAQKLRRWVVAQNGWQDDVMVAKAQEPPKRKAASRDTKAKDPKKDVKVAAAKKGGRNENAKVAAAKKGDSSENTKVAAATKKNKPADKAQATKVAAAKKKSGAKETAVARKDDDGKRVRQSFAGAKSDPKS